MTVAQSAYSIPLATNTNQAKLARLGDVLVGSNKLSARDLDRAQSARE